jgi:intracellular protein transport protein USO1
VPPSGDGTASGGGDFFVPADNNGNIPPPPPEDEDDPLQLMQIVTEHLSLALISRPKMQVGDSPTRETREWDRIILNYICLLVQWLWDDPKCVRAYLEAGGLTLVSFLCYAISSCSVEQRALSAGRAHRSTHGSI